MSDQTEQFSNARGVGQGAVIVALFSILAKLTGLWRERLLAGIFGAGDYLDAYDAAFRFPDLIFNTLIIGALGTAFIPLFLDIWHKEQKRALEFASGTLQVITALSIAIALVIIVAAPLVVPWLVPGFPTAKQALVVELTRIMALAIIFFGASNVLASLLNAFRQFVAFSVAPILYNLGIIFGLWWLVPHWGVKGAAWGVVLGAVMNLLALVPAVLKTPFAFTRLQSWRDHLIRRLLWLMVPRVFGLMVWQINLVITTVIASNLPAGSLAIFQRAFNIQSVPLSVFGVSMAIAAFPLFTAHAVSGDREAFVKTFSLATRRILVLVIPFSILLLLLRAQITRVILGSGAYDWSATIATFSVLAVFAFSFFAQSLVPLFARSFYAFQNTRTPVIISVISVGLNMLGAWWWAPQWGVIGLAAAFSLSSIVNAILLFVVFRFDFGALDERHIVWTLIKTTGASFLMIPFVQAAKVLVATHVNMQTFVGIFTQGLTAGLIGCAAYLIAAWLFRIDELLDVWQTSVDRIKKFSWR